MRYGEDTRLPNVNGVVRNTLCAVYVEMLLQICRDYHGLPDVRTLSLREIRFFYDGLRPELKRHTRPK